MRINSKVLSFISIVYIYIPIALFLFGWTNKIVAIVTSIAIAFCAFRLFRSLMRDTTDTDDIRYNLAALVFAFLLFCWVGYYAGWGRWVTQTGDWHKHNAVPYDLINKRWPVLYRNGEEHSMLSYYIGFYLVPALAGKLTHSVRAAEKVMYLWGVSGLMLVYLNLVCCIRARENVMQILSAIMIPFFGIPLWLSELVLKRVADINRLGQTQWFYFSDDIRLQYSNNFTLLAWVVPQVIACWLTMILFFRHKDKIESYLLLMLPAMLMGILSFLGIVPIAMAYAMEWGIKNKDIKVFLGKIFSVDNILMLLTQGSVLFLYYYGNIFLKKPKQVSLRRIDYGPDTRILFIVFVVVNILIYAAIFWRDHKTDLIYYSAFATLIILPAFNMGRFNDLMMRTSIPGLLVLMVYVLEFIGKYMVQGSGERVSPNIASRIFTSVSEVIVVVLVLVGMYYSFLEFSQSVTDEKYGELGKKTEWETMEVYANRSKKVSNDCKYNYFAYDIDDNLFYKYIMDKPDKGEAVNE